MIDDYDAHRDPWTHAGGTAITFPRPWNHRHAEAANPVKAIINELTAAARR